ncbi:MAG: hypothetical protein ACR2HJ_12160 [Fimbriimonadales bacterium]
MKALKPKVWSVWSPVIAAILGILGVWLTVNVARDYGVLAFILIPFAVGFACSGLLRMEGPQKFARCFWSSSVSLALTAVGLLLVPLEGLACLIMAFPLAYLPLLIGAAFGHLLFHQGNSTSGRIVSILFLGAACTWAALDYKGPGAVAEVRTSIIVDASPEDVWVAVTQLSILPEPKDWFLRSGIACPKSAYIDGSGVGATRVCVLSTGTMPERITVWEPGRALGFVALATPPPLKEINPFFEFDPPHQHGYYKVLYGEFRIEALTGGRSRLTRVTRYESRIRPAFYWNWWCNFAAERAHRYVLEAVRAKVDKSGRTAMAEVPVVNE